MTGLLDLPIELREQIYHCFIEVVLSPPWHPWNHLPTALRDYLALLTSCRQVKLDCEPLFRKHYASRATFNFNFAVDLIDFKEHVWKRYPLLAESRFRLISRNLKADDPQGGINESAEMVMDDQPGFKDAWIEQPGFYRMGGARELPLPRGRFALRRFPEWVPEHNGFRRSEGEHSRCGSAESHTCKTYTTLTWPQFDNGYQLTCYTWAAQSHDEQKGRDGSPACMLLEGRLEDIVISEDGSSLGDHHQRWARYQWRYGRDIECRHDTDLLAEPLD